MNRRTQAIRRQFDRSAGGSYDSHAHVQRMMAERLIQGLLQKRNERRLTILDIGCGTGILTEMLLNEIPGSSVVGLDIAPSMIAAAGQRMKSKYVPNKPEGFVFDTRDSELSVRFILADIEVWAANAIPKENFDLIVSNASFQWLTRPGETLINLRKLLVAGGELAFATFGPGTFRELHEAFDDAYRSSGLNPQRHGLTFHSLDEWNDMLQTAGFQNITCERALLTEVHASVRSFLLSVKAVGASTSEAIALHGIGVRRLFSDMYEAYEEKFSTAGGIIATYEIFYFQARTVGEDKDRRS